MATKNKDKEPKVKVNLRGGGQRTKNETHGSLGGSITVPVPGTKGRVSLTGSGGGGGSKKKGSPFIGGGGGDVRVNLNIPIGGGKKKNVKPKLYGN